MKHLYLVGLLFQQHQVSIQGGPVIPLDITRTAEGMIGMCPVFKSLKTAKKFAGKNTIYRFQVNKNVVKK